ncbi:hypothetical protein [Aeromonas hydrophila]|uniref:hypothetical protein n=1 Tax=Aeromonas hydrophila TaxID=644 RepID=UPI003989779C
MEPTGTAECPTSYVKDVGDFLLAMYDKSPVVTAVVIIGIFAYIFYSRTLTHFEKKIIPLTPEQFRARVENGQEMRQGGCVDAEPTGVSDE